MLTARKVENEADMVAAARSIDGPDVVAVTVGSAGVLLVSADKVVRVPAPQVEVVDTTAAGDAFCGALADALARGEALEEAARWAVTAAAISVTRLGAQPSLPSADEVRARVPGGSSG
jgi:ribokinase